MCQPPGERERHIDAVSNGCRGCACAFVQHAFATDERWAIAFRGEAAARSAVRERPDPTARLEMTTLAACLAVTDTTLFVLCLAFTPLSTAVGIPWVGYGWDGWHGFVVPHAIVSGGLVVTLVSARSSGAQDTVVSIATLLHPVMVATYEWAMLQWPGGDDGGGMAWLLFIGPLTAASLLIAAGLACKHVQQSTGHRSRRRRTVGAAILTIVAVAFSAVALRPWLDIVVHF